MGRLSGKSAFITGAGSGIGRSAALLFAREGAEVAIADISDSGDALASEIARNGGSARFIHTDVTDPASVESAIAEAVSAFGKLDVLYNNAGGSTLDDGPVTECSVEEFWRCIKLDLFGTWLVCKFGLPALIAAGGGAVINTSSMLSLVGFQGKDAYIPAKGGVSALTRSLAVGYAKYKIRVNALAPGMVDTARGRSHLEAGATPQWVVGRHIVGVVSPDDVAQAALYLASDESLRVTGQIIQVDSGYTIS